MGMNSDDSEYFNNEFSNVYYKIIEDYDEFEQFNSYVNNLLEDEKISLVI